MEFIFYNINLIHVNHLNFNYNENKTQIQNTKR